MGRRRLLRHIGTVLVVVGVLGLAYGATVYLWRDPVTDLWTRYKQHHLDDQLAKKFAEYRQGAGDSPATAVVLPASWNARASGQAVAAADGGTEARQGPDDPAVMASVRRAAERMYESLELGEPLGRLVIPKLGIDPVFVNGTRWGPDLSRGPGRYPETSLPGLGRVTAIAGHRTTFGAPFRHIDRLERGDEITLELPYGTFTYSVTEHKIVANDDWSIIASHGFDELVLSACHPLFSASQRWVVFARLVEIRAPE